MTSNELIDTLKEKNCTNQNFLFKVAPQAPCYITCHLHLKYTVSESKYQFIRRKSRLLQTLQDVKISSLER